MSLAAAAGIVVGSIALAVGVLLLVRRRAPEEGYFRDGDRAAGVFGVLATGFAVLLGFVVFLAFENYDVSRTGAESEALTVAQQYETALLMPASARGPLTGELICYARSVVHRDWPLMESGEETDAISPWGAALFKTLREVDPETAAEQAAYSKWLDQTSAREEGRHDRLHGAEGVIPGSLWIALFVIAGVILVYMIFFADRGERPLVQAVLVGSVVAVFATTLLLIGSLNRPFHSGYGGLQPVAFERTLHLIEAGRSAIGQTDSIPCDANGTPV